MKLCDVRMDNPILMFHLSRGHILFHFFSYFQDAESDEDDFMWRNWNTYFVSIWQEYKILQQDEWAAPASLLNLYPERRVFKELWGMLRTVVLYN